MVPTHLRLTSWLLPMMLVVPTAALPQQKEVQQAPIIGTYFFGGWRPGDTLHVTRLLTRRFSERMPARGWYYTSWKDLRDELSTATNLGVRFMAFDWYPPAGSPKAGDVQELNWTFYTYLANAGASAPKFAVLIVNHHPFQITRAMWPRVNHEIATILDEHRDLALRVDGGPVVVVFDPFLESGDSRVRTIRNHIRSLRAAIVTHGFQRAWIGACVNPRTLASQYKLEELRQAGYDFATAYHYLVLANETGTVPFGTLIHRQDSLWQLADSVLPVPYAPNITTGWDPRPWYGLAGIAHYAEPSDSDWRSLGEAFSTWQYGRRITSEIQRLLFIYSWNETGEGPALVPRAGNRSPHASALLEALRRPYK